MSFSKLANFIADFFSNMIFLSCITSWFLSQLIKAIAALLHIRRRGFREVIEALLWRTGGMPSSHTAVVTSMTASLAFNEGYGSNLFAVSLFVAMVVIRDAMGVRRAVGLQARTFNLLGKQAAEKLGIEFHPVKEIQGHAPLEVIAGGILGIFISAAFAWL